MPSIVATKNGNWNDPTVWHLNRIPEIDDVVLANGFTVNIDISTTVKRLSNSTFFGLTAVPIMTGYTTPSGIASAQNEYDTTNYQAWKAFNGSVSGTNDHWIGRNGRVLPEWLQYEFSSPKVIIGYSLQTIAYDGNRATDWQFQAWNGTEWIVLDTNTGSPSQTVPYVRTFTNITAYSRYRIYITNSLSSSYLSIGELRLFETATDAQNAVQGGGFILNPNVSLTCTEYIEASNATILSWAGGAGTTSTVNSPILYAGVSGSTISATGLGTLNLNIATITTISNLGDPNVNILNVNGQGTINVVGNIRPSNLINNNGTAVLLTNGPTFNLTGNLEQVRGSMSALRINGINIATVTITGDVIVGVAGTWPGNIEVFAYVTIIGTLKSPPVPGVELGLLIYSTAYLTIIGPIITYGNCNMLYAPNTGSNILLSGPFVSSPYGVQPVWAGRYHLITSATTYVEFRDSTTGGSNFPGPIAPTAQFISPSASSDSPSPANVRFGVSYAYNSLTGTLRMPHPNQVTYGVPVDNTFGNAVLTAASVWDYLVANITVEDSIGMRLKNVATPQTVGAQLASLL